MDKIISFIVSISMLFSSIGLPVSSLDAVNRTETPVVHVVGSGDVIKRDNADGTQDILYPPQLGDGFIEEAAGALLPVFSPMALDNNGEASDGSYVAWSYDLNRIKSNINPDGSYRTNGFEFHYDWRLDPLKTAETLHKYIEDVLYVTGANEVALYGRCLGSNVVAAYMYKYDGEYVSEVIHYASAVYGATQCSKAFTGELRLHKDGLDRFAYDIEYLGVAIDDVYLELIQAIVRMLHETYGLDIAVWAVNNVLKDIYLEIFPEFMRATYGTLPSYWSMVSLGDYNKAMDTVFYGVDKADYAGLIEKVERYRNYVQLPFGERSMEQAERGIEFSNIVKYGIQSIPVTDNSDDLSDGLCTVNESSFGATCTLVEETFTQDYINKAKENGTFKYISPDTTWFVKNLFHMTFPESVNCLVADIVNNDGYTVNSSEEYPQYLVFESENGELLPMNAENQYTTQRWYELSLWDALKIIFEFIKSLING